MAYHQKLVDYHLISVVVGLFRVLYVSAQNAHAFLNTFLVSDGYFADCPDASLDKLGVHLQNVLPQLIQHAFVVLIVYDSDEDFACINKQLHFLIFYVVGVAELAKEAFDFILED